ncbi:MAG: hypothetical protein ACP5DZ_08220 [Bacteroidales bacterium]
MNARKNNSVMENYRDGGKVKQRTIATLTKWPKHLVDDLEKLLKVKAVTSIEDMELSNGKAFGAIEVVKQVAHRLGIQQALGNSNGNLPLKVLIKFSMWNIILKGEKIKFPPTNLPEHTKEILHALDMTENVAKKKLIVNSGSIANKVLYGIITSQ